MELKAFEKGNVKGGSGPSFRERRERSYQQEVSSAVKLGREILSISGGSLVDPTSGQCPSLKKAGKKKTPRQRTVASQILDPPPSAPQPLNPSSYSPQFTNLLTSQPFFPVSAPLAFNSPCTVPNTYNLTDPVPQTSNPPFCVSQPSNASCPSTQTSNPSCSSTQTSNPPCFVHTFNPLNSACQAVNPTGSASQPFASVLGGVSALQPAQCPRVQGCNQQTHTIWHSGMSLYPYELIILLTNVKVCYGCSTAFANHYQRSPYNVVIKHCDRRVIRRDQQTQQPVHTVDFHNTYCHLIKIHFLTAK